MRLKDVEGSAAPMPTLAPRGWGTRIVRGGTAADFDGIARAYRWLEYLSLGTVLERTRFHFLDAGALDRRREALVLGDGDGRFTRRLLARNREVRVTAVDLSGAMLGLLERRCAAGSERLRVRRCDARVYEPEARADLVVTHFFLDCLSQDEVRALVGRLRPLLAADAVWMVSEFRIPEGWLRWPARVLVRLLYFAFWVLTGLRVTRLPDHGAVLRGGGFELMAEERRLGGLLISELWGLSRE